MPPRTLKSARGRRRSSAIATAPLPRAIHAVERAAPAIVKAVIGKAKKGSYTHAKFLFDFAGLAGAPPSADSGEQDSLARLLWDELQRHLPEGDASRVDEAVAPAEDSRRRARAGRPATPSGSRRPRPKQKRGVR